MRKTNFKQIFGIFILYMLGASPLAITYSYAEMDMSNLKRDSTQENWKIIITEKVVNGKLQVKQYTFPKNASTLDIQKILSLEGENDWVYASHSTYQYGIVLFDGKSSNIDGFSTKILPIDEGLEFGNSESSKNKEISYKIIFSGKMIETNFDINSVISIMNLGWKILQLTQNDESNLVSFQNLDHIDFSQKMNSELGKIISIF